MFNIIRTLMENVENIYDQMDNDSTEMEILKKIKGK